MSQTFDRPFPALTAAQRLHFEVHGYVVVENTLTPDAVTALKDALYTLRDGINALKDRSAGGPRCRGAYHLTDQPHHTFMASIVEADPVITAYATHPRLVSMSEEVMGGEARIVEMNAHINSRPPRWDMGEDGQPRYGFHRGADIPYGAHIQDGLYHCSFVKTLTNLTDLGPDDGGTVVIAGSHKIDVPQQQILDAAYADRSLIHQVVAPAGSTLLFCETLMHATGWIRSDNERVIIITGYGSTMFPYWDGGTLSEAFCETIPPQLHALFHGRSHWTRGSRYRKLSEPRDDRPFSLGRWDDRPVKADEPQGAGA